MPPRAIKGSPLDTPEMTIQNGSTHTWGVCQVHPLSISQSSLVKPLECPYPSIQATLPPINTQPHPPIPHFYPYLKAPHHLLCCTLQRLILASRLEGVAEVRAGVAKTPLVLSIKEPDLRVPGIHL